MRRALQGYIDREGLGTGAGGTLKLDKCDAVCTLWLCSSVCVLALLWV